MSVSLLMLKMLTFLILQTIFFDVINQSVRTSGVGAVGTLSDHSYGMVHRDIKPENILQEN